MQKFREWAKINEIEQSDGLKLISFFVIFVIFLFHRSTFNTIGTKVFYTTCWPFFQKCEALQDVIFFNSHLEFRGIFSMLVFSVICYAIYVLIKNKYYNFYLAVLALFLTFILPWFIIGGYHDTLFKYPEQYIFFIVALFLFTPGYRFFFLQVFFILSYLLATISKIGSDTWLLGFLSLPYIPELVMPIATNLLIILQLLVPVLLISKDNRIRIGALILLELFHLYTVSFIGVLFFCVTSPFLFILFYSNYKEMDFKSLYKSFFGGLFILILLLLNLLRLTIPQNDYLTFEGAYTGFNMFHSTKGCLVEYVGSDSKVKEIRIPIRMGNQQCDPYNVLLIVKENCGDPKHTNNKYLKLYTFFPNKDYITVDEADYCSLEYSAFTHNDWIEPRLIREKVYSETKIYRFFTHTKDELQSIYTFVFYLMLMHFFMKSIGGKNLV